MIKLKEKLINLIFPEDIKCIFCGRDVPDFENKPYCEDCEKQIVFNNKNKCLICAEPIGNEATVCDRCQKTKMYFKKAFCPFVYDTIIRKAILAYKSDNKRYLAKTLAKYIAKEIEISEIKIDKITYIPMTVKKTKKRTFNHAKRLAEELGKILDIEVVCLFEKTKDAQEQKYLNSKERASAMEGLYVYNKTKLSKDDNILIVDDIITTGSTVNYCAKLIYKKVANVFVCAVARNKLRLQK